MTVPRLSRRTVLLALAACLILAALLAAPWLSPARGVERTWAGMLSAIEDNDMERLGSYLKSDYSDGFGHDREAMLKIAAAVRGHFVVCNLRREQSELIMASDNQAATARALVRLGGHGSPVATAAIQASESATSPTVFRFRRNSWRAWDWRLVSVDNPDAVRALRRFEREAASLPGLGL